MVSGSVDEFLFCPGEIAPKKENHPLKVIRDIADHGVSELLPPYSATEIVIYMLRQHNILTRDCSRKPGLDPEKQYMRIAVRNHEDNSRLIAGLKALTANR